MIIQCNWEQEDNDYQDAHHAQQEAQYENIAERIAKRHQALLKAFPHTQHNLDDFNARRDCPTVRYRMQQERLLEAKNPCIWKTELRKLYEGGKHFCWKQDRDAGISGVLAEEYMDYYQQYRITGFLMQDENYADPMNEYVSEETERLLAKCMTECEYGCMLRVAKSLEMDAVEYYRDRIQRQLDDWFDDEFGANYSGEK